MAPPRTLPENRFWAKVEKTDACWLWRGAISREGYSKFWFDDRHQSGHRFAYITWRGPISPQQEVDHLCRVRHCVNPAHLELVSPRENQLRGATWAARNCAKTVCARGHVLDAANTAIETPRARLPRRVCRECRRQNWQARNERVAQKRAEQRRFWLASRTCQRGHPFNEENTYWFTSGGRRRRICHPCRLAQKRAWRARRRAEHAA